MLTGLDAAMTAVGLFIDIKALDLGILEEVDDVAIQASLVLLERQSVVAARLTSLPYASFRCARQKPSVMVVMVA